MEFRTARQEKEFQQPRWTRSPWGKGTITEAPRRPRAPPPPHSGSVSVRKYRSQLPQAPGLAWEIGFSAFNFPQTMGEKAKSIRSLSPTPRLSRKECQASRHGLVEKCLQVSGNQSGCLSLVEKNVFQRQEGPWQDTGLSSPSTVTCYINSIKTGENVFDNSIPI